MSGAVWATSGALFAVGLATVVLRRQMLAMLLGVELMVAAADLALVRGACRFMDPEALAAVAVVLAVAAAEAVVGLSLILRVLRSGRGLDAGELSELRG